MAKYQIDGAAIPQKSAHPDYEKNLKFAEEVCKKEETSSSKINGLKVKVSDSEYLEKALLIISWTPGTTVKRGNYATPVFLHQYNDEFKKTTTNVLSCYKNIINEIESTTAVQQEFLPPSLKV